MSGPVRIEDLVHCLPLLVVGGWACLTLLADALGDRRSDRLWPLAALGLAAGLAATAWSWVAHRTPAVDVFGGMIIVDRFALFLDGTFLLAGLMTLLLSGPYMREHRTSYGELSTLVLLSVAGMMLLVHSGDFLTLVIGLETMSLGVYALVASWAGNAKSAEAGFKYFIMGAVGSAFLLYGVALLYGAAGHTSIVRLASEGARHAGSPLFLLGMFLILGAMGFKVALVPFHAWTPDAYEGAPTPVTGFMAAGVKAAGFGVLMRVFLTVFGAEAFLLGTTGWGNILWVVAVLTMTVGNIAALMQANIKRMLAYSSIAHAGYLLVGVIAAGALPDGSSGPVLYYLLAYACTTLGAFGMVAWLGSRDNERTALDEWRGLGASHPAAALAMTLFLLSLGGIPPTAGFFGKFYIFKAALAHEDLLVLVIVAALNSVVSIYYYLRPVVAMYFSEGAQAAEPLRSGAMATALVIAAILVLLLGLVPGPYLSWADHSVMAIVGR